MSPELIDYKNYRFGRSRQRFRGPKPNLDTPYIAFIGGSETYGKFVEAPFPQLVEQKVGVTCANWGSAEAGPGFFIKDPVILEATSCAEIAVIAVMGAVNNSNRLYSVFKRRNARLRSTNQMLDILFPELDLGQFRFAHNMLYKLYKANPSNFKAVQLELREAWKARMRELLDDIETVRVLLWISTRTPDEEFSVDEKSAYVTPPAFVDREMLEAVAPMADLVIEYVPDPDLAGGSDGGLLARSEDEANAWRYPGQAMHQQVADLLAGPLHDVLTNKIKI